MFVWWIFHLCAIASSSSSHTSSLMSAAAGCPDSSPLATLEKTKLGVFGHFLFWQSGKAKIWCFLITSSEARCVLQELLSSQLLSSLAGLFFQCTHQKGPVHTKLNFDEHVFAFVSVLPCEGTWCAGSQWHSSRQYWGHLVINTIQTLKIGRENWDGIWGAIGAYGWFNFVHQQRRGGGRWSTVRQEHLWPSYVNCRWSVLLPDVGHYLSSLPLSCHMKPFHVSAFCFLHSLLFGSDTIHVRNKSQGGL